MPIYDFICAAPKPHTFEQFLESWREANPPCTTCFSPTERVWGVTRHVGGGTFPYTTTHLSGSPIEVTSPAHQKQLLKQYGKRLRDDAAFVETESYVDPRGRTQYREGRGDGGGGTRWF